MSDLQQKPAPVDRTFAHDEIQHYWCHDPDTGWCGTDIRDTHTCPDRCPCIPCVVCCDLQQTPCDVCDPEDPS